MQIIFTSRWICFPSKIFECYDNANNLLATSTTGIFTGLSGTSFFFKVKDSCTNVVQTPLIFKPVVNLNSVNADCINGKVNISGTMTVDLLGTIATHLFGGSAGREGTAVQMGGAIADQFTKFFKFNELDRKNFPF